jgi:hypothetical protein
VSTHRGIAGRVHQQKAGVCVGRDRLGKQRRGDVSVTSWRQDDRSSQGIGVPLQPIALLRDRTAMRSRKAFDDEPKNLTADVGIDGLDEADHV